ncbi:hypothetical protein L484_013209 [Morus notabilis]|uniref:Secreted protein n=1 Tax=Morus notabilis TaxID=981085 RepID=W9RPX3_9ROSA|nr:hypothetical protein L484_013209 [Morus notabilis]
MALQNLFATAILLGAWDTCVLSNIRTIHFTLYFYDLTPKLFVIRFLIYAGISGTPETREGINVILDPGKGANRVFVRVL